MRKTLTLSQQTEEYLTYLKAVYAEELSASRVTDGWVANVAIKLLYEQKQKEIEQRKLEAEQR